MLISLEPEVFALVNGTEASGLACNDGGCLLHFGHGQALHFTGTQVEHDHDLADWQANPIPHMQRPAMQHYMSIERDLRHESRFV